MRDLERAALVNSASGRTGGFTLNREAASITLADIYRAVEDEGMFRLHKVDPESPCPVGCQILNILSTPLKSAESALADSLAGTTLADIAAQIA
jgi:DNA-binding IscR family transcriptional regulator